MAFKQFWCGSGLFFSFPSTFANYFKPYQLGSSAESLEIKKKIETITRSSSSSSSCERIVVKRRHSALRSSWSAVCHVSKKIDLFKNIPSRKRRGEACGGQGECFFLTNEKVPVVANFSIFWGFLTGKKIKQNPFHAILAGTFFAFLMVTIFCFTRTKNHGWDRFSRVNLLG